MRKKLRIIPGLEERTLDALSYILSYEFKHGGNMHNNDKEAVTRMFEHLVSMPIRPGKHYKEDLTLFNQRLYDVERRILLIIDKLAVCCDDRDKLFRIVENLSKSE